MSIYEAMYTHSYIKGVHKALNSLVHLFGWRRGDPKYFKTLKGKGKTVKKEALR